MRHLILLLLFSAGAHASEFVCPKGLSEKSGVAPHPWFDDVAIPSKWCVDKAGKKNGPWWAWDPKTNSIVFRASTNKGELDGQYEMYFDDGTVAERGAWKAGRKVGEWVVYKPDGSVETREKH